jgi:hypothetical protein
MIASMSRMEINEPRVAEMYVSCRRERLRRSVNDIIGKGS